MMTQDPKKKFCQKKINDYFDKKEKEESWMNLSESQKNKLAQGREYRSLKLEVRKQEPESECIVEGYATTFNQPYILWQDDNLVYYEIIDRHAFDECDMSDVIFQYDHTGRVFARTRNKTLNLTADDIGLKTVANLGETEEGRRLYDEIKGGYTDRMSFGFIVESDEVLRKEERDKISVTRTITKISKLYDVSAVSIPANDFTQITARDRFNGVKEAIESERLAKKKMKLKLKIKLMEV